MLRLRKKDRFALLLPSLSMTTFLRTHNPLLRMTAWLVPYDVVCAQLEGGFVYRFGLR